MKSIFAVMGAVLLCLLAASCNPPETKEPSSATDTQGETNATQVKREVREAMTTTRQYLTEKRAEYRQKSEDELAAMRREYEEMKMKIDQQEPGIKDEFNRMGETMRQKLDQAGTKLRSIGDNDRDTTDSAAWENVKTETDHAVQQARESLNNMKQKFANQR